MNAKKKLAMLDAIQEFSSKGMLTTKGMTAFMGDHPDEEKHVFRYCPNSFSWNAKQAVQLALIVHKNGSSSLHGRMAMMEIAKIVPALRPDELLGVSVAMNHGLDGLIEATPTFKLLKVKK